MKGFLLGFVVAIVAVLSFVAGSRSAGWKHWVEAEVWYLKEPAIKLDDGKVLTRKDILDIMIVERLKQDGKVR